MWAAPYWRGVRSIGAALSAPADTALRNRRQRRTILGRAASLRTVRARISPLSFPPMRHISPALLTGSALAKNADDESRAAEVLEMRAIAAGDENAFARLIDRESPRLLRLARAMLGSLDEAEDVAQETFISVWENARNWRPEARIGTWLHRICTNRAIDRLRRRRDFVEAEALDTMPDAAPLAEAGLLRGDAVRSVRDALERLPLRQRLAVFLFYFQELPQSEAATVLGVSESGFESLLARGRRQLRASLTDTGGEHD